MTYFQRVSRQYGGGEHMPLAGYAILFATFSVGLGGLARKASRQKLEPNSMDLLLMSVSTYKLARTLSSDRIASFLRAPFTRYLGSGEKSQVKEEVRGEGLQRALGDLVTCPYCLGSWVAATLTAGMLVNPQGARAINLAVTVSAFAELLQQASTQLQPPASHKKRQLTDVSRRLSAVKEGEVSWP